MKTLMKTVLITAALALAYPVLAAGPASAPRAPQTDMTREQHAKLAAEHFDAMDANKDGKITAEERAAKRPGRGNGPGASMPAEMTKAQMVKYAEERFTALDTNKDGKVTIDERRAQMRGMHHHGGRMGSGPDDRGQRGHRGGFGPQASQPVTK